MTLRAAVFDYGHTLVDFTPAEEALLAVYERIRVTLAEQAYHNLPEVPALVTALTRRVDQMVTESYQRGELQELDVVAMFDESLRVLGVELPTEMVAQIAEMEHRAAFGQLSISPATLGVLDQLRDLGLKIGLVSNAHFIPALMREDIERLGIAARVDDAVFSSEIGVRKPHPAIYLKVLNELDVEPHEAVFVGDRLYDDIAGAKKLGMRGVLTHEFRQEPINPAVVRPDLVVGALPALLPYVTRLLNLPSRVIPA